jgi:YVTN family beta-propeller protein
VANDTVSVITTDSNVVIATIQVGECPEGVMITPNGTRAYVTNCSSHTVSVIATDNNTVIATIQVGEYPKGVAITPNGTKVYVPNFHNATVSVIATDSNAVIATIEVGKEPIGVAITPNGTRAYVTNSGNATVTVIDTDSHAVIATIPVESEPHGSHAQQIALHDFSIILTFQPRFLRGVAITPNGTRAYVTNEDSDTVSVIVTDSNVVIATIQVGHSPDGVAIRRLTW